MTSWLKVLYSKGGEEVEAGFRGPCDLLAIRHAEKSSRPEMQDRDRKAWTTICEPEAGIATPLLETGQ
jgi:hypothetical protein